MNSKIVHCWKIFLWGLALAFARPEAFAGEVSLITTTIDGKNFNLQEQRGKVVIVNFWALWCKDCRQEMPVLEEIYQQSKSQNLEIIAVNIDRPRQQEKVLSFASAFSYPVSMLDQLKVNSFGEPRSIPLSYIIDKNGKIVAKLTPDKNPITKQQFEEVLEPILNKSKTH